MRGQGDRPAGRPAAPQSAGSGRAGGHPGPAHTCTHMQDRIGPYQVPVPRVADPDPFPAPDPYLDPDSIGSVDPDPGGQE